MKHISFFITMFLLGHSCIQGQCRRHEIGLGIGIMQVVHESMASYPDTKSVQDRLKQMTRVNTNYASYSNTEKRSSRTLPALYYGYKLNRNYKVRVSVNTYQEKRAMKYPEEYLSGCFSSDNSESSLVSAYKATYNQFRIATGISRNISHCTCTKTYINLDIAHYVEFLSEKGVYDIYTEAGKVRSQTFQQQTSNYSIGVNPSFGFRKLLCHSVSVAYEVGAELKYSTGKHSTTNFICNPLNRLSLNYAF